ncbi:MAG TPA: hypothetical protein VKX39_00630 [Bryobacteraceae bacterium]|jgi:hypothetical protein|nr:hypothetical protein [Bryobacteraceae bacterium]
MTGRSAFRCALGLIFGCLIARAQLAVFTFNGTSETPVGTAYNYGNIAAGASSTVRFRIFNNGNSPVTVYGPVVNGAGFAVTAINGTPPVNIPPATSTLNFFEFSVTFNGNGLGSGNYSASLQVSGPAIATISVLLLAAVPGVSAAPGQPPSLTATPGCSITATSITFAAVNIGSVGRCNFTLANPNSFGITISSIAVSGDPALSVQAPALPLVLAASASTQFTVEIKPVCGQAVYSGTLMINSTYYSSPYGLSGNAITPPLPAASFVFDAANVSSAQQHTVSIALATPSACGANGYINLAFAPAPNLPEDSTIVFLSGSTRALPFSIAAGSQQALISGAAAAAFSTGSTAGTITFSLSGPDIGATPPSASLAIAPAPLYIDTATASSQVLGQLNITVIGYDNTYSAGQMTFTFFDGAGRQIGQAASADFRANFQQFYSGRQMGSTFLMQVSFPVLGSCVPSATTSCPPNQVVAAVQVTLTNSAGQTQTGTLSFH